jgi:hypothetical protein
MMVVFVRRRPTVRVTVIIARTPEPLVLPFMLESFPLFFFPLLLLLALLRFDPVSLLHFSQAERI